MTTSTYHRSTPRLSRRTVRTGLAAAGAVGLVLATPVAAHAHVSLSADTTAAGASAVVSLNVPHGCEGSPTSRIAIQVPAGVNAVIPTVNQGWTVAIRKEKLSTPIVEDDGDQLTTRVAEVVWTAKTPLPADLRDVLSLQVAIPEDAAGTQLAFPTVQTCVAGSTRWTQVPAAGQDHDELEHPAPALQVSEAVADEHGGHAETSAASSAAAGHAETAGHEGSGAAADLQTISTASVPGSGLGLAGLVLGALGLAAGAAALLRTRTPRPQPTQH